MNHAQLVEGLKTLRLNKMVNSYAQAAKLAEQKASTYEQFLASLVDEEVNHKKQLKIERFTKASKVPVPKSLDNYDFSKVEGISATKMNSLKEGGFVKEGSNIVFYGPSGVGKTHLATGLIHELCKRGIRCRFYNTHTLINDLLTAQRNLEITKFHKILDRFDVIICDELGYIPHDRDGANLFFQLISHRYEMKSFIITTNLTYSEWDKVFLDNITTAAAVDRIIHRYETINISGPSWRAEYAKKA